MSRQDTPPATKYLFISLTDQCFVNGFAYNVLEVSGERRGRDIPPMEERCFPESLIASTPSLAGKYVCFAGRYTGFSNGVVGFEETWHELPALVIDG